MMLDLPVTSQSYRINEHRVMQSGIYNLSQVNNETSVIALHRTESLFPKINANQALPLWCDNDK